MEKLAFNRLFSLFKALNKSRGSQIMTSTSINVRPNGSMKAGLMKTPYKRMLVIIRKQTTLRTNTLLLTYMTKRSQRIPLFLLPDDRYQERQTVCDV